ncbi:ribonuclease D [Thiohalobacter sp. IOR34]|uniref:ribonuclease D n=1 Tax=Thiohalobacter sp. IOR34 TaxID=3057176 RepID=UPI0025B261FC|nr:ribonuclease D [Thiohalobacter sp. IOR34]WJW75411.1 ribonuclease D [Thiohalobacter sp. IOR34]
MSHAGDFEFIDSHAALADFCRQLAGAEWIALDTEFLRERTFYPQLCLLQVATPGAIACIDPLAIDDLEPLHALLYDPAITKVLHAARQDMEIFYHLRGAVPAPLFDTQIAAPLLGHADQIGYGNLVRERLGVSLGKAHTRTDWSRRPLSHDQLQYAADDVRYLAELYPAMRDELASRGRLEWLAADFAALAAPETYRMEPTEAWRRNKGAGKLKGAALSVFQSLCAWREAEAQRRDRPRKWLLPDDVMLSLARLKVQSVADLGRVRGLPKGIIERDGEALLALIETARTRRPEPLPAGERPPPLSAGQEAAADLLMGVLRLIAAGNQLNPGVIAGRKAVEQLVRGERELPLLQGWRRAMAGDILLAVLRGERGVRIEQGALRLD